MSSRCGLALLTGGRGERLGGPKHDRPHPQGGSWGGHLVRVFRSEVPDGPVQLVGAALPDFPGLPRVEDPREGPAVALRHWAASGPPPARRWWAVPCDQAHWTDAAFTAWLTEVELADPDGLAWIFVARDGHRQPFGGFLGGALIASLTVSRATSLHGLLDTLPSKESPGLAWLGSDIDTPDDLTAFKGNR